MTTKRMHIPFFIHLALMAAVAAVFRFLYVDGYRIEVGGRVLQSLWSGGYPFSPLFSGDGWSYYQQAVHLLNSGSYGFPLQPPLTATIIAGAMAATHRSMAVVHGLFTGIGILVPVLTALLGDRWFNRSTGLIAGWLCAISFGQIMLSGTASSEPLAMMLILAAFLLGENPGKISVSLAGICAGLAVLTRSETLVFLAAYLAVRILFRRSRPFHPVLFTAALLLTVMPWTVRNTLFYTHHADSLPHRFRFIPVAANGPINFFIGNGPAANGGYRLPSPDNRSKGTDQGIDLKNRDHQALMIQGYALGRRYVAEHPETTRTNLWNKCRFWSRGWNPGFFHDNFPLGLRGSFRRSDIWTPKSPLAGVGIALLTVAGVFWGGNRRAGLLTAMLFAGSLATALLFFGLARQSAMLMPVAFLPAAAFIDRVIPVRLRLPAAAAAGILILAELVMGFVAWRNPVPVTTMDATLRAAEKRIGNLPGKTDPVAAFQADLDALESAEATSLSEEEMSRFLTLFGITVDGKDIPRSASLLRKALALDRSNADAWKYLGVITMSSDNGRHEAIRCFRRYLDIAPAAPDARQIREFVIRSRYGF